MTEQPATVENKVGRCMLHNWVEERAVAALDTGKTTAQIKKHGHKGILTLDEDSKLESVTTFKAVYIPPKSPGVRLRGVRGELLEKHIAQMISEKIQAEQRRPTPKIDFCSTTQKDFFAKGFVPCTPETTQVNGVTAVKTPRAPFRKSALFSTPISEQLDEVEVPPDN
ncbi:sperm associated antigen 8 isoform X2 [Acanthopagrus latus]|uniref:sperm associated antigen 8 isoform X2 n=1 Tax=Acanthopagrus latus TaxID=8177 RepID=UPI00187CAF84|nr:sperm associated antigen 8 isoform X2 [Acanthopagrus latus]